MAIKNIIAAGIGFSPGSVKFIVTRGLSIGAAVAVSSEGAARVVTYAQDSPTVVQNTGVGRVVQASGVSKVVKK